MNQRAYFRYKTSNFNLKNKERVERYNVSLAGPFNAVRELNNLEEVMEDFVHFVVVGVSWGYV